MNYKPITPERLRAAMAKTGMSLIRHATMRPGCGCPLAICAIATGHTLRSNSTLNEIGDALGLPDAYVASFVNAFDLGHWAAEPDSEARKGELRTINRFASLKWSDRKQGFLDGLAIRDEFIFGPEILKMEAANA